MEIQVKHSDFIKSLFFFVSLGFFVSFSFWSLFFIINMILCYENVNDLQVPEHSKENIFQEVHIFVFIS